MDCIFATITHKSWYLDNWSFSNFQAFEDDESVAATYREHFQPSSLEGCLAAFAQPEALEDAVQCDM